MKNTSLHLWITFFICFFCNVFAGLISMLMPAYLTAVVGDLSNAKDADSVSATINAIYLAGWTVGGFTWGFISDRIGRAKALSLSAALFGLMTLAISFSTSWEWVVIARLLAGFASGGILVITPTLLSEIWPESGRSKMIGIDSIGFPVGIFSSGIVTAIASDWRGAFMIGTLPLIIGLIGPFLIMESNNWKTSKVNENIHIERDPELNANLLKGAVIFGSMLIGLWGMFSWIPSWVQSLLIDSDGKAERGLAMLLLGGGGLLGGFISGWILNAMGARKSMLICFTGCVVVSVLLFGTNSAITPIVYIELGLLALFFGISQGLLSIYVPQLFPYRIRGTYTGICFNIGRIVTTMAVFFVGFLVTTLGGYSNALLTFAGIFVIGFIAVYLTKEQTQTVSQHATH